VLFRRRATLRCGGEVAPTTTYDAFAVFARTTSADGAPGEPQRLGEVSFVGGSSALGGSADAVASALAPIAAGHRIGAADVAAGAPGGDDHGRDRAAPQGNAHAAVAKPTDGMTSTVVQPNDVGIKDHGADGALLLTVVPAPQPVEFDEIAIVAVAGRLRGTYQAAVMGGRFGDALAMVADSLHVLGTVTFAKGSGEPTEPADLDRVRAEYSRQLQAHAAGSFDMYSITGENVAGDETTRTARLAAIRSAVGGNGDTRAFEAPDKAFDPIRGHIPERVVVVLLVP
jgi:hypothetical protein